MVNWFDLMRQAQGGSGLDNLARQFNLSSAQTNAALAALMPAFAMGVRNAAADPAAMGRLMQATMRGPYAAFWESATQAFTPQARREGEELLDQLFGSDDVSRRVARQASSFSGVGVDVMQQMLPLIAGILAGGFARIAQSQGAAIQGAMQALQGQAAGQAPATGGVGTLADLWTTWLAMATGTAKAEAPRQEAGKTFEDMMASFLSPPTSPAPAPSREATPRAEPPAQEAAAAPAPEGEPEPNPFKAWGEIMEKGHEMQRQHLASLQTIIDGVWGKGGKP